MSTRHALTNGRPMQYVAKIRDGERIYDLHGRKVARIRDGERIYSSNGLAWLTL